MAATSKNKRSASSTSEEDYSSSSSDEDQRVAKPKPTNTTNTSDDSSSSSKRTRTHSDSESDPEPPKKNLKFKGPLKPSSPPSDEDEDGDNEEQPDGATEEKKKKKKKQLKASAPDKKKKKKQQLKTSAPDEPPPKKSKKSTGAIVRLWSEEDEIIFLQALSHYHATKGHLPHEKDYGSFLATIRGSISFPVTENQIGNKLRHMKHIYNKKLKNGTYLTLSEPHEKAVFQLCSHLFEEGTKDVKKKKKEPKGKANAHVQMEEEDGLAGEPNGEANADGHRNLTSHPCLRESIEVAIKEESLGALSTVEAVIACMGESTAADLEAKIKVSKIEALKSKARDGRLKADVMDALAAEMAEG